MTKLYKLDLSCLVRCLHRCCLINKCNPSPFHKIVHTAIFWLHRCVITDKDNLGPFIKLFTLPPSGRLILSQNKMYLFVKAARTDNELKHVYQTVQGDIKVLD